MSTYRPYKEAIDFEEVKDQRKDIDILVKVKRERIQRCPEDSEEVERAIEELQVKSLNWMRY